jgi:hypothetical protein
MNKKEKQVRIEQSAERLLSSLGPLLVNHTPELDEMMKCLREIRRARDAMRVALDIECGL